MKVVGLFLLLSTFAMLLVATSACTTSHERPNEYYRRGTIHHDAFPPGYVPGRYRSNSRRGPW